MPVGDGWGEKGSLLRVRGDTWEDLGKAGKREHNFLGLPVPQ